MHERRLMEDIVGAVETAAARRAARAPEACGSASSRTSRRSTSSSTSATRALAGVEVEFGDADPAHRPAGAERPARERDGRGLMRVAAAVAALHVAGFGLVAAYATGRPALLGLAALAYVLGLRHGFDPDHLLAIDNATRRQLRGGPIGLSFSLGHSTVVLAVVVAAGLGLGVLPSASLGSALSGSALCVLGVSNLTLLRGRPGRLDACFSRVGKAWHLYPLGLVFGLGFDAASVLVLVLMTKGAPLPVVVALPLVFSAGMTLIDSADAAAMARAYRRALPVRHWNLVLTSASAALALGFGAFELSSLL